MWVFIVNPAAGNGRAQAAFQKIQQSDVYRSLKVDYYFSEYEGHAEEIAANLEQQAISAIIVVGGDGTIHEVVNGLRNGQIPLGFIPGGSGNDFARGLGIKGKPETILAQIVAEQKPQPYWIGTYQLDDQPERYFVNSMGLGFDAEVAHRANNSSHKKVFSQIGFGTASYVVALLQVIARFKPNTVKIELDGNERTIENCWLLSVGNHPYYGGGMKVMPHAKIRPDLFSLFLVHSVPKAKVIALFLTVFTGTHGNINGVELSEANRLTFWSESPVFVQVDGQTTVGSQAKIVKNKKSILMLGTQINEIT